MKEGRILLSVVGSVAASAVIGLAAFYLLRGLAAEFKRSERIAEIGDKINALQVLTAAFEEESARSDMRQAQDVILSLDRLLQNLSSREPRESLLIEQLLSNQRELGPLIDQWFDSERAVSGIERERREVLGSQIWMKAQFISDDSKRLQDISRGRMSEARQTAGVLIGVLMGLLVVTNGTIYILSARSMVRAQEAVRRSEERARLALEAGEMGAWDRQMPDGPTVWNRDHYRILGYGPGEVTPSKEAWEARVHPEDLRKFYERIAPELKGGGDFREELRIVWPNGAIRWVELQGAIQCGEDGRPKRSCGVVVDFTERKKTEEELRKSEERYQKLFEDDLTGDFISTPEGRILLCNPAFAKIFGFASVQEAVGTSMRDLYLDPEERGWLLEKVTRERKVERFEVWRKRRDGRRIHIVQNLVGHFDERGELVEIKGYLFDDTVRKRAEEALRESEEHFRSITNTTPVIMWMTDTAGVMEFVNRAYGEFFGVELEQLAKPGGWQVLVHTEDAEEYIGRFMEALRSRSEFRAEARVRRADGQWRWIQSYGAPRFDDKGEFLGMAGSSPDITERREFQAELERLVAERTSKLHELVGELEHFSYTITHDLKAPLRAMRGFAELAGTMCGEGEYGQAKKFLRKIMASAERMDRLIADALSYSRSVRQELPLEYVDAGALLRGILDSYPELQAERARIRVEGTLPVVLANDAGLTQCFSNLLGNAVKFVKPGETPDIRVWAEEVKSEERRMQKAKPSGWVRIWVEDKGIGISKEMLPRVFDMFVRGSKDHEGTGIGLALVRKVAQRMGGKVGVESEQGKGSRFWIELSGSGPESMRVESISGRGGKVAEGSALYVEREVDR